MIETDNLDILRGDERIVAEAKKRFQRAESWEANTRKAFVEDVKFANGDAENGWQWPQDIRSSRVLDERPSLTVNKTRQHNLMIINDAKRNKPEIRLRPTGGSASYDSAKIYQGVTRRIEYQSNAQAAYDNAVSFQVQGGIGYWRVITDYAGDDSFDQEIFIRRIKDPLNVLLDPDINEHDGSDAKYGFIFDDMPREEFEQKYPEHKYIGGRSVLGSNDSWLTKDHVRVAEYYRRTDHEETLLAITDPTTGQVITAKKKDVPKELLPTVLADPNTRKRKIVEHKFEWLLIAGDVIVDRKVWPGKYIPIVRVVGEEMVINGILDRKGHTRSLRDPQRIYNYWTSSAVEFVALQAKMPYIAPVAAIEGHEEYWTNANKNNYAVLPYNAINDEGVNIPPPQRQQPPQMAQAYISGLQIASNEMMMVSGQYQATMGAQGNEQSGLAINERQRQGDTATYHFIDNFAHAIRFTGKILIDLIPKIYDTPRIIKILAEDGSESEVQLDPNAQQAYVQQTERLTNKIQHIFNPAVGNYEVEADIGPSYGTKRQEAFHAFTQIASQNPSLMNIVGDLMFKSADFPGADEISERLRRMVPEKATQDGPSPEAQDLQAKLQQLQQGLVALQAQLNNKEKEQEIKTYNAITDRLKTLLPTMVDPNVVMQLDANLIQQEQRNSVDMSQDTAQPTQQSQQEQGV